jgi:hypothetical protein
LAAVVAMIYAFFAYKQSVTMAEQLGEMRAQGLKIERQSEVMASQGRTMEKQLEAADSQGRTMEKQLAAMAAQSYTMGEQLKIMQSQLKIDVSRLIVSYVDSYVLRPGRISAPGLALRSTKGVCNIRRYKTFLRLLPATDTPPDADRIKEPFIVQSISVSDEKIGFSWPETAAKAVLDENDIGMIRSGKQRLYYVGRLDYVNELGKADNLKFCKQYTGDGTSAWQDCYSMRPIAR